MSGSEETVPKSKFTELLKRLSQKEAECIVLHDRAQTQSNELNLNKEAARIAQEMLHRSKGQNEELRATQAKLEETLAALNEDKELLRCTVDQLAKANAQQGHLIAGLRNQLNTHHQQSQPPAPAPAPPVPAPAPAPQVAPRAQRPVVPRGVVVNPPTPTQRQESGRPTPPVPQASSHLRVDRPAVSSQQAFEDPQAQRRRAAERLGGCMGLKAVKNHTGKLRSWPKLSHDELVDMSQFGTRKKLEIWEKKDSGSKHQRTLSMFADCIVCHNGYKFKWFRPMELLSSMKTSKVESDLLILEWKAGTALEFTLKEPESVQLCCESRDQLIEEIRNRFGFVTARPAAARQPRQQGPAAPPSYSTGPDTFVQPPAYDAVTNASQSRAGTGTPRFSTVSVDVEGLIARACALGYPDEQVRAAMRELQATDGNMLDINKLLDKLN